MKTVQFLILTIALLFGLSSFALADSAREINSDADRTLQKFYNEVPGGKKFLDNAKGYVIFNDVNEAGFFIGGKYGEGVLRVAGKAKSYHSITSASIGFQMGLQNYALIIAFTSDEALKNFILDDDDWETDIDTNIIMAEWSANDDVDEIDFGRSMIGFAFDSSGMMGNFTMEGTKFERINPDD